LLEVYSVTLQQLVTRFHLLETLTQLPIFYTKECTNKQCIKIRSKKQKYVHKQSKMESQRNAAYITNRKKIKKRNRHQHNTDDGRQAVGEEMRRVQMSR